MSRKSVTDAVDKAEHRRRSKKLKQRLNITSGQRLFIFLSAIVITLISFLYAGLYNDKHGGKAAPGDWHWQRATNDSDQSNIWASISSSDDGTKLIAATRQSGTGSIFTSDNGGMNWTKRDGAGTGYWSGVSSSSDGTKLVAVASSGFVYTSSDSGANWIQRTSAGNRGWKAVTSSSDGTKLVAAVNNGYIYTSSDSGATWTEQTSAGSRQWTSVASSSSGDKIVASVWGSGNNYIYTSSDSGATWTEQTSAGSRQWTSVASSSDGMKLVATTYQDYIYHSVDFGNTWSQLSAAGNRLWTSVISSDDGVNLFATSGSIMSKGYIFASSDSGNTWTQQTSAGYKSWSAIASSDDSTKISATESGGFINVSSDSGATWQQIDGTGSRRWISTASSEDSSKLVAASMSYPDGDYIYTSSDYGENWVKRTNSGSRMWVSVTSSSDGAKLIAAATNQFGDYLFASSDSGVNWVQLTSAGSRMWSSVDSSPDGTKLVAVANNDYIYTSSDSGATWTTRNSAGSRQWQDVDMSDDGVNIIAVVYGGYAYQSSDSGNTWTQISSIGSKSWASTIMSNDGSKLMAAAGGNGSGEYLYTSIDFGASWTQQSTAGSRNWSSVASSSDGTRVLASSINGPLYTGYLDGFAPPSPFIMTVKTDNPGSSNNNQYTIPTNGNYTYSYNVDCGNDGSIDLSGQTGNATCTFGTPGTYDIAITGTFPHMYQPGGGDAEKITGVKQWGSIAWQDMGHMFDRATNITAFTATDIPDLSDVENMIGMFYGATSFNGNISNWDTSNITNMSSMLQNATNFNSNINSWDTSSVTNMNAMFAGAASFNQPLNNWNVGNVISMPGMFEGATSFNQSLNSWDVSKVTDMQGMLKDTTYNQPLDDWDVSSVEDMKFLFQNNQVFNQPLNSWNTASLETTILTFGGATSFNQPLSNWNTSSLQATIGMFSGASAFDQSLADWDLSTVQVMDHMFGNWNTSGSYPVSSGLSTPNYDATLIGWSSQTLQNNVIFDAGTSQYCFAEAQRQSIINTSNWTINDSGKGCAEPSAPLSPSITEVTTTSMKLNWSPPADDGGSAITSYQVQYKASSSGTWISAPVQGPSPTTHVLTNLSPNTSYDFRVAAINAIGASPYTSPVSATTLTPSTPSPSPSPSVTPDPTPTPTTTVTPTPDPEVPTTDTRTNTPVPGTPVYKPKPSATPAPQRVQDGSSSFTEKLRGYIGALGPSASYAPASLLILLVALAIFYLYQTWREQQVYTHLDKLLRRYRVSKQLRADFVNLSSHYLNTPLQIMRGSLELAQTALPHMAHEIKVIAASLEIMSHDTASLLQANQDSTEASASLVQLDKQDLPHLMRRTGVWLPVVSTVALMLIFEIVILVVGRMGLNPYTVGVFICLTIFAGLMVLFTYRARWRLRSLNKQAQAALSFERNIDSQRVSFMETTTKELNDQLDAIRLPAEKLLATGQVPTFANGYAMLGQVATKLSQITTVGQVSAETALTPLKPWLESHLPVMTEYVESQGMKFNSKIEPNLAVNLTREALAQIVSSLIGNAVKFSKAGAEIGLTIVPQGDMIHLSVQDTGVGIAKDKLTQLMQPFARGTDVLAYDYEGIGLSLYLDRLIAERVGGELTMQSVVGRGTTVSLLLPRAGK